MSKRLIISEEERTNIKSLYSIKLDMKSPLTGREMILMSEPSTLDYKGKTYNVIHHYYLCELSNEQFTTTELDEQNLQ